MFDTSSKEVAFHQYCPKCQFAERKESEDPCWECLDYPTNYDSHQPVNFKARENYSASYEKNPSPITKKE